MKLSDKLKKQIKENSTKSQESYAGLMTDLRVKYKPYSNTGLKAMEMLYDITSGAEADSFEGLKTRLVRLDQLRDYLLKTSLEPREQKKVFTAFTKVQSAIRGHKDQYDKKFADMAKLLDGAASNVANVLDSTFDEFPLFKIMLKTGVVAAQKIKEQQQKRAQTLRSRNDTLRKDSEQMYARELEKENGAKPGKNKGGSSSGKNFFTRPTTKMSGAAYVHDNAAQTYATQSSSVGMEYMQDMAQNIVAIKDVITTDVLNELRQINKYNNWQKTQAKDKKLDDLETLREASRNNPLKLVRERAVVRENSESSNSGGIVDAALDALGIGAAAKGVAKVGRSIFKGAKGMAGKALGGMAKMGGKSLLKKIPILGLGAGGIFAIQRALSGDYKGAGLELASGAASTIPGLGTAASVGIDTALAAKDAGVFDSLNESTAPAVPSAAVQPGAQNQRASLVPLASLTKNMNIKDILGADGKGLGLLFPLKALDAIAAIATGGTTGLTSVTETRPGGIQRDNAPQQAREQLDTARRARKSVERRFDNKIRQAASKGDTQEVSRLQAEKSKNLLNIDSNRIAPLEKKAVSSATGKMLGKSARGPITPAIPSGGTKSTSEMKNLALKELQEKGITDPTQQANILANLQAESNFTPKSENLNYSASTLMRLFGPGSGNKVRVRSMEEAQAIVDQGPEAVGNLIYGGRMGNAGDEGYKYRGRGLVQLTGKDNYADMSKKLGLDLVNNPELANDPAIAAKIQAQYYADRQNKFDYNDVNQVSKATGHAAGAKENLRRADLAQQLQQDIQSGKISSEGIVEPQNIQPNAPIVQASAAGAKPTAPIVPISQNQSGGVQGVDYAVDPDTGEKFYYDSQTKQSMQQERALLQQSSPQMTSNQQTVAEGSKATALAAAAPQTPAVIPVSAPSAPINMSNSSSEGQTSSETGTDSRRMSYINAIEA